MGKESEAISLELDKKRSIRIGNPWEKSVKREEKTKLSWAWRGKGANLSKKKRNCRNQRKKEKRADSCMQRQR